MRTETIGCEHDFGDQCVYVGLQIDGHTIDALVFNYALLFIVILLSLLERCLHVVNQVRRVLDMGLDATIASLYTKAFLLEFNMIRFCCSSGCWFRHWRIAYKELAANQVCLHNDVYARPE